MPAAQRILERKRTNLNLDAIRPYDWVPESGLIVDDADITLNPFNTQDELVATSLNIFEQIDGELARYFAVMADDDLLDLETRKGKALGGYCYGLPLRQKPFIFMNGTGTARNVTTLFHEAGHAFHGFEAMAKQPLVWQQRAPMEFNEVASMAMELISAPYPG